MKLIRLHLQGFKSFKDKTTIHFDEGITGIVGPNGCGKSNIVDALFWVMGEQSAKHLRGNKMKDLIFAGSSKYSPASFAEVTLVLENNTGKHIHIGSQVSSPSEIALTRKLYRNGETEYRINNIPARLKDIQEVFMDTGAGAKSYSIIAQGEINRLVQAKPIERRTMIEEVAGITKFKMRKRDSVKKIEQTQANLNRLSDLQSEIYKTLKSLERQAEKAEKARRLKGRIKHHELIVKSHKEFDHLTTFVNSKSCLEENHQVIDDSKIKKNQIELTLEDERNQKIDLTEKIDTVQSQFNEMSRELAAGEERLKYIKSSCDEKAKHIKIKQGDVEEVLQDKELRGERLSQLNAELSELQGQNFEEMDFSGLEAIVLDLQEQLEEKKSTFSDLKVQKEEIQKSFQSFDQECFRNSSRIEEYSAQLEDINAEVEEIEKTSAGFTDEIVSQREEVKKLSSVVDELEESFAHLKQSYEEKKDLLQTKDSAHRSCSRDLIQLESRIQSLQEVSRAGEGVKKSAQNFIEKTENNNFAIFGSLVGCEEEYAKALEIIFKDNFNALVGNSGNHHDLFTWYTENKDESLDYMVEMAGAREFGEDTKERIQVKGCEGVTPVEDVVRISDKNFEAAIKKYFNGFYLVDDLDVELGLKIVQDLGIKGLISKDGLIFITNTAGTACLSIRTSESSEMGVVQRNNLLTQLNTDLESKQLEFDQLENEVVALRSEVEALSSQLEEVSRELKEASNKYIALKSSLDSKEGNFDNTSKRLEILNKRRSEISQAKLDLLEKDESVQQSKEQAQEKLEDIGASYEQFEEEITDLQNLYDDKKSELLELQAKASSYRSQVASFESQIEDINNQLLRFDEKAEETNKVIAQYQTEIEEAESEQELLSEKNNQQAEELSDIESRLTDVKDQLAELLAGMQERENEIKSLTTEINRREKLNVELELKVEKAIEEEELLVRDIFERYSIDLRDTLRSHLQYSLEQIEGLTNIEDVFVVESEEETREIEKVDYQFEKRFPAVLRESKDKFRRYKSDLNRLGEINWQAIEDYDRQKLRHDFLKKQEEELKHSLVDLETAIQHIDEKSRIRFKEAFDEVNIRFTKVFPIIFGGGEARLEIVGHIDSPECGIDIIAKPPGKKMQSINLMSGGEKAMTAVSLIFSIFLVKPSPFCLLDEVDAPLDDANVGRFNELLREMSAESQFILITHNKKTMELNDTLYGVTMQEPGVSKAVSVQLQ